MLIIIGTFIANLFFDTNIMVLILIDGIIGLLFMRAAVRIGCRHTQIALWEFLKSASSVSAAAMPMPLIQASVVDTFHWLTMSEFVDILYDFADDVKSIETT